MQLQPNLDSSTLDTRLNMYCQVCGLKNSDEEEFCSRCHSSSSCSPESASSRRAARSHEEIPFDEHLLERISTLEDVVKRTGDAVKTLFESLGNLEEEPLRGAHRDPGPAGDPRAPGRHPVPGGPRSLGDQDGRPDAGGREEGPLPRAARPHHGAFSAGPARGCLSSACAQPSSRSSRSTPTAGFASSRSCPGWTTGTSSSASTWPRRSSPPGDLETRLRVLQEGPRDRAESLRVPGLLRHRGFRARRDGTAEGTFLKRALEKKSDAFLPHFALGALYANASRWDGGGAGARRALEAARVPAAHVLLGTVLREKGEIVARHPQQFEEARRLQPGLGGRRVPARTLLPREEPRPSARSRVLSAGAGKEPEAPRVPGGGAAARRAAGVTPCRAWTGRAPRRTAKPRRTSRAVRCGALTTLYRKALGPSPRTRRSGSPSRSSPRRSASGRRPWRRAGGGAGRRPRGRRRGGRVLDVRGGRCARREDEGGGAASSATSWRNTPRRPRARSRITSSRRASPEAGEDLDSALDYAGARSPRRPTSSSLSAGGSGMGPLQAPGVRRARSTACAAPSERAAQPTTFHHLGMAYLAAGKPEEAKAAFTQAKTVARGGRPGGPDDAAGPLEPPPGREVRREEERSRADRTQVTRHSEERSDERICSSRARGADPSLRSG